MELEVKMNNFIHLILLLTALSSTWSYAAVETAFNSRKLSLLEDFLAHRPGVTYVTPSSPNYPVERETYIADNPAVPLAIVRPQNANDVAALVSFSTSNGIDFVVRSGGHDVFGRSQVDGALTIDMRDINFVDATKNGSVAKIGGGILTLDLATKLSKYDLVTAFGSIGSVGYVGWSSYGGYASFSPHYGLGVDQIVGAKIVNPKGEIVEANPAILKGIRGAGGVFGVIVELTIKVYPLRKFLAGAIFYNYTDISVAFDRYARGYNELEARGLPPAFGVQPIFITLPPQGKLFGVLFVWSSPDLKAGRVYLNKLVALGNVAANTVVETTAPEWITGSSTLIPQHAYGGERTVSVRKLTDQVIETIGRNVAKMPLDNATGFSIQECRGPSAKPSSHPSSSVFEPRTPHFVLEMIASAADPININASQAWAATFRQELLHSSSGGSNNVLAGTYISVTKPGDNSLSNIYGSEYPTLLALKRRFDPNDVFNHAVPRL